MADVFISYASSDRARVLAVTARLRELGVTLWIDQNQIPGTASYGPEIVKAIKACKLLFLMATGDSLASKNVRQEVGLAWKHDKPILPFMLEDCEIPDDLAYWLEATQYIVAHDDADTWMPKVVESFRQLKVEVRESPAESAGPSGPQVDHAFVANDFLPYLADRREQERHIFVELQAHFDMTPERPLLFVAHGDRSQCLDGFVDRLQKFTLPRHLARLVHSDQLEWKQILWPNSQGGESNVRARALRYREDVNDALYLAPSAGADAVAQALARFRKTVVFSSMIYGEHWARNELDVMRQVASIWGELPNLPRAQPLMIFLTIVYRGESEHVLQRWLMRRANPAIRTLLASLGEAPVHGLKIVVLPELADVMFTDVDHWVRDILRPADLEDTLQRARALFAAEAGARLEVPMLPLTRRLKELVPQGKDKLRGI